VLQAYAMHFDAHFSALKHFGAKHFGAHFGAKHLGANVLAETTHEGNVLAETTHSKHLGANVLAVTTHEVLAETTHVTEITLNEVTEITRVTEITLVDTTDNGWYQNPPYIHAPCSHKGFTFANCAWIALSLLLNLSMLHPNGPLLTPQERGMATTLMEYRPLLAGDLLTDLDNVLERMKLGPPVWSHETTTRYMTEMKDPAKYLKSSVDLIKDEVLIVIAFQKPMQCLFIVIDIGGEPGACRGSR